MRAFNFLKTMYEKRFESKQLTLYIYFCPLAKTIMLIKFLKNQLDHTPRLKNWIKKKLPSNLNHPTEIDAPSIWLTQLLNQTDEFIVQIGSNDGKQGDPVFDLINKNKRWKCLFVEPIPYLFEKLKSNYGDEKRFTFVNAAINDGTEQTFYCVKEEAKIAIPNLPFWYDQLGSFEKQNIIKHLNGKLEPFIMELKLNGKTLPSLLEPFNHKQISLLHIDTEGYDWKILSQLDQKKHQPKIILFEHKHLTELERKKAIQFLTNTYRIFQLRGDIIALSKVHFQKNEYRNLKGFKIN